MRMVLSGDHMSVRKHGKSGGWRSRETAKLHGLATGVYSSVTIIPRGTSLMQPYEADAKALRGDMNVIGGDLFSSMKNGQKKPRRRKAAG